MLIEVGGEEEHIQLGALQRICEFKGEDGKETKKMTSSSTLEALENHQWQVGEQVGWCPWCATWISRLPQDLQKT